MAQVRFYGATLPIGTLRDWYNNGFTRVVFQLESDDSNKNRDSYYLIAYPYNPVTRQYGALLKLTSTEEHAKVNDRLLIGNLPFYSSQIERFLNAPGVTSLLFTAQIPKTTQPKLKDYVIYKVESQPVAGLINTTNIEDELHPSPPALPPGN